MFKKIMVPIDLVHRDNMGRALDAAADLARRYRAEICLVGVTATTPGPIAHTPEEFGQKLADFADQQAKERDVAMTSHVLTSHDPRIQMNRELESLVGELNADLVVMATHLPGIRDYVWSGHGAHMAAHSDASVFLVR